MLQIHIDMKNNRNKLLTAVAFLALAFNAQAERNVGVSGMAPISTEDPIRSVASACTPAKAKTDLDINNVRATIMTGGDFWWDLVNGCYFVPKPAAGSRGPSSLFAGSLWIGGYDAGGQLKAAGMTYRQTGNDFWPGPLDASGVTDATTCDAWDKHFKINRKDVETYYNWRVVNGGVGPNPTPTAAMDLIDNWPVTGTDGQPLAPFYDMNSDGIYQPFLGEVPDFDITGTRGCAAKLFGDQNMFWVFNDKGNVHSETGGQSIGIEIQSQAFGFATNDEINNQTFYRYRIVNKSSFRLDSTFFGVWVDADLGGAYDDYVGCDVSLGLGFCYNGDLVDDNGGTGQLLYGVNPPAIGVDFFEGPFADPNGADDAASTVPSSFLNYGNGTVDDERIGMKKFMYYNNDATTTGNPDGDNNFYQYLSGTWLDDTPMTYGGDGHQSGGINCSYMFPGASDPIGYGTNFIPQAPWDEASVGNTPADRRFLQSAGPFTLQPGAVNTITTGVVWARATQGGNLASLALLKGADAKAQKLFDRCFKTLDGPTAPNLTIQELNNELILYWTNPTNPAQSNNANEAYTEDDNPSSGADSLYRFQGYMIYQLKDATVSATELYNPDRARLVFQCDKKDGYKQIVNYTMDDNLGALVPEEMVSGADAGIVHSTSITEDKFAVGNPQLINHKSYYYAIVAYGYSTQPSTLPFNPAALQDYLPFIAGRKQADGFFVHTGIPHIPNPESGGTVQNVNYGSGPKLTRIEGQGNGGMDLDFTAGTVARFFTSTGINKINDPQYENARGPVNIKVIDPLNVPNAEFLIRMFDSTSFNANINSSASEWYMVNLNTNDTVWSDKTIAIPNEQIIAKWGMSVNIVFTNDPGSASAANNGFISASMEFSDPSKRWLTAVADGESEVLTNWIRSGTSTTPADFADYAGQDDNQDYEKVLNGTWAPYRLCASTPATIVTYRGGPAWNKFISLSTIPKTASVDVVLTSDKSKWTRCPVLEEQDETALAVGAAPKLNMRESPSVDKNGKKAGDAGYNAADGDLNGAQPTGMGWFPGYALNLETGERLNMAFGEDSWLVNENGADMIWNPTSTTISAGSPIFGGKHYIYVFGHNDNAKYASTDAQLPNEFRDIPAYDLGVASYKLLKAVENTAGTVSEGYKREFFADAMWVNIPLAVSGRQLLETDVKVRLRVGKAYKKFSTGNVVLDGTLAPGQRYYVENGPITHNSVSVAEGSTFVAVNANYTASVTNAIVTTVTRNADPYYSFSTADIQTATADNDAAKSALDLINIVPNPYYAYSGYEKSTLDNIVKITNLPDQCTITIYTLNGTQIRKFKKDDSKTSLDWDLKNQARIPIASGIYIIHVDVPNVGEKVLKWFGVLRPIDLESY
jgi:hypothetical protein